MICITQTNATAQTNFVKRIGSVYGDAGVSCKPTLDDGIILAEISSVNGINIHCGLVRTDADGGIVWSKNFMVGDFCPPNTVVQANEGFVVYGSATDSTFMNNNKHFLYLHKVDMNGNTLWDRGFFFSNNDWAAHLINSKTGGFIAASTADYNIGSYSRAAMTRLDENGFVLWTKQYATPRGFYPQKIVELANGNIAMVAYTNSYDVNAFNDVLLMITDANGDVLHSKVFQTYYDDEGFSMATNASGDIFITGRSYFINTAWDSFLIKTDSVGTTSFINFYDAGTSNGEIMRNIVANDDGSTILLGDVGTWDERDITMMLLDNSGAVQYIRRYGYSPQFTNYPFDLFKASNNDLIFTGDFAPPTAYRDGILVRTDPTGFSSCYNYSLPFTVYNTPVIESTVTIQVQSSNVFLHVDPSTEPNISIYQYYFCAPTIDAPEIDQNVVVSLYPNPASDKLYIEFNGLNKVQLVSIYSLEGKMLNQVHASDGGGVEKVDVSALSAGIYFYEIESDHETIRGKFMKN